MNIDELRRSMEQLRPFGPQEVEPSSPAVGSALYDFFHGIADVCANVTNADEAKRRELHKTADVCIKQHQPNSAGERPLPAERKP